MQTDRSWTCYPQGLQATRRAFLRTLAAAAAASSVSLARSSFSQNDDTVEEEPLPDFPAGGFAKDATRLNFNENPLGPSPKAIQAILQNRLAEANRYNFIDPLVDRIAKLHGIEPKNVLIGCGSTEFLQFVPWAYLKDGGNIVLPEPTYGWSGGVAAAMGRDVARVPLAASGVVDVAGLKNAIRSDTRMLYIANPNNPTGAALSLEEVSSLVEALPKGAVFLVDEAYNDFLPEGKSAIDLVRRGAPVLVARTFSKGYGLAGLRLGYAIGPDEVLDVVKTVWWGDLGINSAASLAGPAAIDDQEHVSRYVRTIDSGLEQLRSGLARFGFRSYPHRAPFFMTDTGKRARPLVKTLQERNVYVRDGNAWKMPTFLRVSVGTDAENERLLRTLRELA
jgi:histidinol-phosphate aminotransferase